MPGPQLKNLAQKAGVALSKAEQLWNEAKKQAKGAKLKDGSAIPDKEGSWTGKHYAYVVGILKSMMKIKESAEESQVYRVVINGDEALLVRDGQITAAGDDASVDEMRYKIQELLDRDHPSAFDIHGVEGTLSELNARVFAEWLVFCTGDDNYSLLDTEAVEVQEEM